MDFEVFLLSQIKEHADAGEDSKRSVVCGLLTSGRVIPAAAMIMGFGLGRFDFNGDPTVKPFGIGLAVVVILDAKVVRCLLVLARTASLGKANSYLARPDPSPHQHRVREALQARDRIPAAIQLQAPKVLAARS